MQIHVYMHLNKIANLPWIPRVAAITRQTSISLPPSLSPSVSVSLPLPQPIPLSPSLSRSWSRPWPRPLPLAAPASSSITASISLPPSLSLSLSPPPLCSSSTTSRLWAGAGCAKLLSFCSWSSGERWRFFLFLFLLIVLSPKLSDVLDLALNLRTSRTRAGATPMQNKTCNKFNIRNSTLHVSGYSGKLWRNFNLVNWQFCRKSPNLEPANIISYTIALCGSTRDRQI